MKNSLNSLSKKSSIASTKEHKNILTQFLPEANVLCNIGGIFGVLVGFGLGNLLTIFTGFSTHVPLEWAFGGLAFCTGVGLTFGLRPAVIASKLDPIEALRLNNRLSYNNVVI